MTNRLAGETSPYLLQHAHNPVDWYPWGPEAFAKARMENRPIFLSVGYSACHWCHVMERESFEDIDVAALLNEDFVSIKVDREERPDVDSIYMQAVQLMNGHGGWPMSVFLTPEAAPFYAGTYFPPDDRHGMPSFRRVLAHVSDAFRSRKKDIDDVTRDVVAAIGRSMQTTGTPSPVTTDALNQAAASFGRNYDAQNGGFGGAPKFPPSMTLDFLMQASWRTDDAALRSMITTTLTKMARGGIYDQIGGGFHRYSVDARWLVPHFEKMLYDNALLARLYTRAWQWTKDPLFARIAQEILDFVSAELTSPDGAFYSTLDADSEGVEGKFYVWSRAEVMELLGEHDGRIFCALYDISQHGNWEESNIPNIPRDPEVVARELQTTVAELDAVAARGRRSLYEVRARRVWPGRDEKILSGWNGWMLAAFAEASLAFDRYHDVVRKNADFLCRRVTGDGRITRHRDLPGLLEDYSGVAWGLTLSYEALHERRYLDVAGRLVEQVNARFTDATGGGFFDTADDHESLITRPRDLFDNATPAGTSVMCDVLMRHAILFERPEFNEIAKRAIESTFALATKHPTGFGMLLAAAEWSVGQPREVVLTGREGAPIDALRRVVGETYLPHLVLVSGEGSSDLPLMRERATTDAMAYVCMSYTCQEPTGDPSRLLELLKARN